MQYIGPFACADRIADGRAKCGAEPGTDGGTDGAADSSADRRAERCTDRPALDSAQPCTDDQPLVGTDNGAKLGANFVTDGIAVLIPELRADNGPYGGAHGRADASAGCRERSARV